MKKNQAYAERNKVLGLAAKLAFMQGYTVELWRHPVDDKEWENDWRNIVAIQLPSGWLTWHIHDDEMPLFAWIRREQNKWDGHTTEEKYKRLKVFVLADDQPKPVDETKPVPIVIPITADIVHSTKLKDKSIANSSGITYLIENSSFDGKATFETGGNQEASSDV